MGGVTGDFTKLKQLQQRLGKMVGTPKRVPGLVSARLEAFVREEFGSHDAMGAPLKPLKPKTVRFSKGRMGGSVLRSGGMRDTTHATPEGEAIRMSILGKNYARFQITTSGHLFPKKKGAGLPPRWRAAIEAATLRVLNDIAGGR